MLLIGKVLPFVSTGSFLSEIKPRRGATAFRFHNEKSPGVGNGLEAGSHESGRHGDKRIDAPLRERRLFSPREERGKRRRRKKESGREGCGTLEKRQEVERWWKARKVAATRPREREAVLWIPLRNVQLAQCGRFFRLKPRNGGRFRSKEEVAASVIR